MLFQAFNSSVSLYAPANSAAIDALLVDYNAEMSKSYASAYGGQVKIDICDFTMVLGADNALKANDGQMVNFSILVNDGTTLTQMVLYSATTSSSLKADVFDAASLSGIEKMPMKFFLQERSDDSYNYRFECLIDSQDARLNFRQNSKMDSISVESMHAASELASVVKLTYAYGSAKSTSTVYDVNMIGLVRKPSIQTMFNFECSLNKSVTYNSNSHDLGAIFSNAKPSKLLTSTSLDRIV